MLTDQLTQAIDTATHDHPEIIPLLSDKAIGYLVGEVKRRFRRDKREPRRKEKEETEYQIYNLMRRRFRRQKQKVLQAVGIYTNRKADWLDYIFTPDADDERSIAKLIRLITRSMQSGIDMFSEEIGIDLDWTITNVEAARAARDYAYNLVRKIDTFTRDVIRNQVQLFIETPGMTLGELAQTLPFNDKRAFTIAVTETTRAYADGKQRAGDELKKKYPDVKVVKTWFTNMDDKVCEICGSIDTQEVEINEQFVDKFDNKYDNPPAHPNCRCWTDNRTRING
jgi:hypothetical protein